MQDGKTRPKSAKTGRTVVVSHGGTVNGAASTVKVPGFGDVTVVNSRTFASAKDAAGSRLRTIIASGDWKPTR